MVSTGMPLSEAAEPSDPRPLLADPRPLLSGHALDPAARAWLDEAVARIADRPAAVRTLFPAARRRCGRARLDAHWTVDEAARAVLLAALPLGGRPLADELAASCATATRPNNGPSSGPCTCSPGPGATAPPGNPSATSPCRSSGKPCAATTAASSRPPSARTAPAASRTPSTGRPY